MITDMDDKVRDIIRDYIKNNLAVYVDFSPDEDGDPKIKVTLRLEGEEVHYDSDFMNLSYFRKD